jgi:pimeloyl-ACP methyl ester carboxylesterase
VLTFEAADKVRMGGTLSMPERTSGPVGAVLIVPSMARNDRNGYIDIIPADPIYQDLSKAITGSGLAAFRYDRRSMGESKLDPGKQQFSFEDAVTDAHEALLFLSQRTGIDGSNLAIVGHDLGGIAAMKVAATDDKVKSVVLLSTPGRPLVDVMAGHFERTFGTSSADAFRGVIGTLLATGSLPERSTIRPEHQTMLPTGNDALLRDQFSLDPIAQAAKLKVPTLVVTGRQSTMVAPADGDLLKAALPSAQAFTADSTASLQKITAGVAQSFDAADHRAHGGGRPPDTADRDQPAVNQITTFLTSKLATTRP